jgi:hypothetical protein
MIPPLVQQGTRSPGERELFLRFRDDPATSDWVVLHSLDIARHETQREGEADFVVIIPGKGVLCLEVKAHYHVCRQDGLWLYGARAEEKDARGPFKQASDAMHSIRKRVTARDPSLSRIVFWSGVVFTSLDFRIQSEEWHDWQVLDSSRLRSRPISALFGEMIDSGRAYLAQTPSALWFDSRRQEPEPAQCTRLVQLLRPDFEAFESPRARAQSRDAELKRYTAEQFAALDAMAANPRVVFEGPAGTGKTLLAIEAARRARAQERRVLLLCFNRMLGNWLEKETEPLRPEVSTSTLHRYMLGLARQPVPAADPPASFWEIDLPAQAIDRLLADGAPEPFDEVIVDEAQDILRDAYLDVIDLSLRGGLAAGRWRLFGDFEGQAIYGAPREPLSHLLERRAGCAPRFSLRINCRNTPRVAELVHALGGLRPPYTRVLRPDDGVEPEIRYFADEEEQTTMLANALEELERDGFRGSDVIILSPRAHNACADCMSAPPWAGRLRPAGYAAAGHTSFCSIHAFKGLEAPAVIVTDVDRVAGQDASALFYVATTRALHRLIILAHQRVKAEARALIKQQLLHA